jgi:hypothetical protein
VQYCLHVSGVVRLFEVAPLAFFDFAGCLVYSSAYVIADVAEVEPARRNRLKRPDFIERKELVSLLFALRSRFLLWPCVLCIDDVSLPEPFEQSHV